MPSGLVKRLGQELLKLTDAIFAYGVPSLEFYRGQVIYRAPGVINMALLRPPGTPCQIDATSV